MITLRLFNDFSIGKVIEIIKWSCYLLFHYSTCNDLNKLLNNKIVNAEKLNN